MRKSFQYRAYPKGDAERECYRWFWLCRRLWNAALEYKSMMWNQWRVNVPIRSCLKKGEKGINGQLTELKEVFPEYKEISAETVLWVTDRLDNAYNAFYKGGGFPKYKGRDDWNSFALGKSMWKLDGDKLIINRCGAFELVLHRPIQGVIKTITVLKKSSGKWYVSFSCDEVPERHYPETQKEIGIDVNVNNVLTDQNGNRIENDGFLDASYKKMRRLQRSLSRKKKGSIRYEQVKLQIAKLHEHIANQRKNRNHVLSHRLVNDNALIAHEDLTIKQMVRRPEPIKNGEHYEHNGAERKSELNKGIHDVAWGQFFGFLAYKGQEAHREIVPVNPSYTTLTCSGCGTVDEKLFKCIGQRRWKCDNCGLVIDEDHNAAINILRTAQVLRASNSSKENLPAKPIRKGKSRKRAVAEQLIREDG